MTPDEREQMAILCQRIAVEQDRDKFTELVDQLNELLDHKRATQQSFQTQIRLTDQAPSRPSINGPFTFLR